MAAEYDIELEDLEELTVQKLSAAQERVCSSRERKTGERGWIGISRLGATGQRCKSKGEMENERGMLDRRQVVSVNAVVKRNESSR